jgi:hypothetical protein
MESYFMPLLVISFLCKIYAIIFVIKNNANIARQQFVFCVIALLSFTLSRIPLVVYYFIEGYFVTNPTIRYITSIFEIFGYVFLTISLLKSIGTYDSTKSFKFVFTFLLSITYVLPIIIFISFIGNTILPDYLDNIKYISDLYNSTYLANVIFITKCYIGILSLIIFHLLLLKDFYNYDKHHTLLLFFFFIKLLLKLLVLYNIPSIDTIVTILYIGLSCIFYILIGIFYSKVPLKGLEK